MSDDKKNKKENEEEVLNNNSNLVDESSEDLNELDKLRQEKQDLENQCKRALADYQNLVKNVAIEKNEIFKYSLVGFLTEILPVYDNLKTAIRTLKPEEQNNSWVEGIKYVIKQFKDIFTANGIEEIKTIGEKFDYNTMEAVEGEGDIVSQEIRPGYILNGKVIIPAKVIVLKEENEKLNNK
jgi:molecular chaperone GrpE